MRISEGMATLRLLPLGDCRTDIVSCWPAGLAFRSPRPPLDPKPTTVIDLQPDDSSPDCNGAAR
jgi:hypothetical protein